MGIKTHQLAELLGISRQRVNELGRIGKLTREPDGTWDPGKARLALGRNLDHRQPSPSAAAIKKASKDIGRHTSGRKGTNGSRESAGDWGPRGEEPKGEEPRKGTLLYEQWRHTREKASREELERRVREGELLERSDVIAQVGNLIINAKTNLRGIGAKIAPDLAAETSDAKCQAMVDSEIDEALMAISKWKPKDMKRT
jgi:hypothetical protein